MVKWSNPFPQIRKWWPPQPSGRAWLSLAGVREFFLCLLWRRIHATDNSLIFIGRDFSGVKLSQNAIAWHASRLSGVCVLCPLITHGCRISASFNCLNLPTAGWENAAGIMSVWGISVLHIHSLRVNPRCRGHSFPCSSSESAPQQFGTDCMVLWSVPNSSFFVLTLFVYKAPI